MTEKVLALLSWRHRVRTALLILLSVLTAALETMGIASVAPFLAVLAAPDMIEKNRYLKRAYTFMGSESRQQFLLVLGCLPLRGWSSALAVERSIAGVRFASPSHLNMHSPVA